MASDLSSLLNASKTLTAHLHKPDLPAVNLSIDQIEAQSRRLVSRQPGAGADHDRANYLLAQAHVDAPALSSSIAQLNTASAFTPLQPLQDTDVAGYIRHAHEQNLISTIEESRRETQEDFYRILEERVRKDWEARKRRVFDELGGRSSAAQNLAVSELKKSYRGGKSSLLQSTVGGAATRQIDVQTQSKMVVYAAVIDQLNHARLHGISFTILHTLETAASRLVGDAASPQMAQNFRMLAKIAREPHSLPSPDHANAHALNPSPLQRKYARVYLGDQNSREAVMLRRQIAKGAREMLEEQYWDVIQGTIQAQLAQARLGGDPSIVNKMRAYVFLRHNRQGEWEKSIQLIAGQPIWAKLYYMVRCGFLEDALEEAVRHEGAINNHEADFVATFRAWVESPDRRLSRAQRDYLQSVYASQLLHSATVDPFKLALYKLMGRLEPERRSVSLATATMEDWLWFQLAMVDEGEQNGLRGLADVLLGYGPRHFEDTQGDRIPKRGTWAGVLLMCGEFERAVAALWEHPETEVEAVHLAIALAYYGLLRVPSRSETSDTTPLSLPDSKPAALSLSTLIWRYVRQFVKIHGKEAIAYVYSVTLSADQGGGVGQEELEMVWELVRRIIVSANPGPTWDELIGGFKPDGTRFTGFIERNRELLNLRDTDDFNAKILVRAAEACVENDRMPEAISLYNIAGDYSTVIEVLAQALANLISQPAGEWAKNKAIEDMATGILRHYERLNLAAGRGRDAVSALLQIRRATEAKEAGNPEIALDIMEQSGLVPLDGDVNKISRNAEQFKEMHEALQRNLHAYLMLTIDVLASSHQRLKNSILSEETKSQNLVLLRKKSKSLIIFAGMLKYRMSPEVYSYLARLEVEIGL